MHEEMPFIDRFHVDLRATLTEFAAQSPRLADLAHTHPLAFIALATGYGDPDRRAAALQAVLTGRRLRTVCDFAAIPYCLRWVSPELCPPQLSPAKWSNDASSILARFISEDEVALANWVPALFFANAAAGEAFALWLAVRHELFVKKPLDPRRVMPLAMYHWFAHHPQHELHRLLPDRWRVTARSKRALSATRAWLYRICCRVYLPASDGWENLAAPFEIGPFHAIELTDFRTLLREQQAMDNCLDRYGRRIASGTHAMFSLRTHEDERVANFEVALHAEGGPIVCEIRGRSNGEVADDICKAVLQWVATSPEIMRRRGKERERTTDPDAIFADLIAPYVESHPELLATYGPITLDGLERHLKALADRLKIQSWPARFERTP